MALLKGNQTDDLTLKYLFQNAGGGGCGLPQGGTTGQVLSKKSDDDYDTEWSTPSAGSVTDVEVYGDSVVTGGVAEIPDTVHVGASAPTDAKTKIWLDTDEQGVSVVTSVNGQSGAVTLPFLTMELLWTNPSPSSNFAAQTVSLDLSGYIVGAIVFAASKTDYTLSSPQFFIVNNSMQRIVSTVWAIFQYRDITVSTSGITFSGGNRMSSYGGGYAQSDAEIIPIFIYGIKGIT